MRVSRRWILGNGLLLGLPAFFAAGTLVPALLTAASGPRSAVVALWTALGVVAMLALVPLGRRLAGPSAVWVAAGATLGLGPTVLLGGMRSWAEPLVYAGWRCGTGDATMMLCAFPVTAGFVLAASGLALGLSRRPRAWLARATLLAAVGAAILAALQVVALSTTLARPSADGWAEATPVVRELRFGVAESGPGAVARRALGDGLVLVRRCEAVDWNPEQPSQCVVALRPASSGAGATACDPASDPSCRSEGMYAYAPDEPLVVRRDEANDLWVVEGAASPTRRVAFDRTLDPVDVTPVELGATISAPRPLFGVALGGLALGLLVLFGRGRLARRRRRLARARSGRVEGADILFDDGQLPARGLVAEAIADGPALAEPVVSPEPPAYRDDGTRGTWRVTAGTRDAQLAQLARTLTGLDLLALSVIVTTALPLLPVLGSVLG